MEILPDPSFQIQQCISTHGSHSRSGWPWIHTRDSGDRSLLTTVRPARPSLRRRGRTWRELRGVTGRASGTAPGKATRSDIGKHTSASTNLGYFTKEMLRYDTARVDSHCMAVQMTFSMSTGTESVLVKLRRAYCETNFEMAPPLQIALSLASRTRRRVRHHGHSSLS